MRDKNIYLHLDHRQTGRTTQLIEWLKEGTAVGEKRMMIVHSQAEAERVYAIIKEWYDERDIGCPIESWQVSPVDRPQHGRNIDAVSIDNLELMLYHLTGPYNVAHIYATKPYDDHGGFVVLEDE